MSNHFKVVLCLFAAVLIYSVVSFAEAEPTLLLRYPTVSNDHTAFIYAGDLWIADRDGSNPRRLTVHPGLEYYPHFSPDGKLIAFTGNYDGNMDVFIVSADGGAPVRLTCHPDGDWVEGWSPDGKSVLFRSNRDNPTYRYKRLYTVSIEGGFPQVLPMPHAEHGSFSPDMSRIAYTPLRDAFGSWKRYRGGRTAEVWLFDFKTNEIEKIPRGNTNDSYPVWLGDKVYLLSDHYWTMNVFSYDPQTKEVEQITFHDDYDVKFVSANAGVLIYEQAGKLHIYDPNSKQTETLDIYIDPDLPHSRPRIAAVDGLIHDYNISPTGKRGLFEARGDIFTVPKEKGDIRNLTNTPGVFERFPVWSPDGAKIAYFSDAAGEYQLMLSSQDGMGGPEVIGMAKPTYYMYPSWSPDSRKILFSDKEASMFYHDLEKGKTVEVDQDNYDSHWMNGHWSPDNNWIAYVKRLVSGYRAVFIYSLDNGKIHQVTDGMSDAVSPAWSKDGKYLYFTASTNWGLHNTSLDMSSFERPVRRSIYVALLDKTTENPFIHESDEEEVKKDEDGGDEKKDDDEEEAEDELKVVIDFENLDQRILSLPISEADFYGLGTDEAGKLYYMESVENGNGNTLHRFDMSERESEEFLSGIYGYEISADGKNLIYEYAGNSYGIVSTESPAKTGDGGLSLTGMKMKLDPKAEWKQIFEETWRLEREYFYDPQMHGCDWNAVKAKYEPFLKHVGHRADLVYLQSEMIGELVVGHAYVWGGDEPEVESVEVGMLGADYELHQGYYRFKKIYSGLNWNPDLRAPLTEPGVNVNEGDYLLAVNGVSLTVEDNIYTLFQGLAKKQVKLTVNSKPILKDARQVTVKTLSNDRSLRYMAWVEGNRKYVDEATNGQVAYVYMPNTAWAGYHMFNRYYFSQLDKKAVILDERWNGGGKTADYIVDLLDRPLLNWWVYRTGKTQSTPNASIYGPKVMIINESAGSGGDAMPAYFKRRGLGKLVGKRTWGGLVGISYVPPLIDGGVLTSPSFGVLSPDGEWEIENHGVDPDIVVEMTPKDVIAGHDPQLEKAVEVILEELKNNPPPEPNVPPFPTRAKKPE